MNWLQFQIDLNKIIHDSEERRKKFEEEERERRSREYERIVKELAESQRREYDHPAR